jgi:hypothetical protein
MPLFTFIMEYRGGTYLSQIRADTHHAAPAVWAAAGDWSPLPKSGKKFQVKLFAEIANNEPEPVEGLANTWCIPALIGKRLALIHFIQTLDTAMD